MKAEKKPRGPWINRLFIRFLTFVLGLLIYWLLGFMVNDIASIEGPDYETIEDRHVDQALEDRSKALQGEIGDLDRQIAAKREERQIVADSSQNLQQTITQLIELQKLTVEKEVGLSEAQQENLAASLAAFLETQTIYQETNAELSLLLAQKRDLEEERGAVEELIAQQKKPARKEYQELSKKHRLKLAGLQLLLLIPLLVLAAVLIVRKRSTVYFPLYLAFGVATLLKVGVVIHRYFPQRYFKYILIAFLLLAVGKLLVHFIRIVAFPKIDWLTKQYREAYERFLCPVCEFPIRIGPRRFLFWTRRTVKRALPTSEAGSEDEEEYTCPSCGTALFEKCASCGKVRHSLLPHCRHCGSEKDEGELTPAND